MPIACDILPRPTTNNLQRVYLYRVGITTGAKKKRQTEKSKKKRTENTKRKRQEKQREEQITKKAVRVKSENTNKNRNKKKNLTILVLTTPISEEQIDHTKPRAKTMHPSARPLVTPDLQLFCTARRLIGRATN